MTDCSKPALQVKRGQAAVNKDAVQTALGVRNSGIRPFGFCVIQFLSLRKCGAREWGGEFAGGTRGVGCY